LGLEVGPGTPVAAAKPHVGHYLNDAPVVPVPSSAEALAGSGIRYLLVSGIEARRAPPGGSGRGRTTSRRAFLAAAALAPRDPRPLRSLAAALLRHNQPRAAREILNRCLELDPDDEASRSLLDELGRTGDRGSS
jgi:hypothetical protein